MKYDTIAMKSIAETLNDRTYTDFYYRLMLIARSVFQWDNLPNNINEKWIERYLFLQGECMFFKDKEKGFMVTGCTESGGVNYYNEPVQLMPVATNYTGKAYTNYEDCVMIQNNDLRLPTAPTIELYAWRLAELTRTADININAQKTPVTIVTSDKQRASMQQIYKKWNGLEPFILIDKTLDPDLLRVLKTDAPIVFDKLQIQKHEIWNECMTFLGVNNANMNKRERLVADEVSANNEQIAISAAVQLKAREHAAKEINRIFGTDIKVSLRKIEMPELPNLEGVTA